MEKIIFWSTTSLYVWIISLFSITAEGQVLERFYQDIIENRKKQTQQLQNQGMLTEDQAASVVGETTTPAPDSMGEVWADTPLPSVGDPTVPTSSTEVPAPTPQEQVEFIEQDVEQQYRQTYGEKSPLLKDTLSFFSQNAETPQAQRNNYLEHIPKVTPTHEAMWELFDEPGKHRILERIGKGHSIDNAFDTGFGAASVRDWYDIKRAFADPRIGSEALKKHYQEHGAVNGTLRIALSPVTIPIRSWGEIIGGEPGLGEYPLKVLIGAAVVLLWVGLILSKLTKQTKYNYKTALSRFMIAISVIIFFVCSIIDGVMSGMTFVLYAVLFLGIQYLLIFFILYYVVPWVYRYVILWIYSGLKQQN